MLHLWRMWIRRPANNRGYPRCSRSLVKVAFFAMTPNPSDHVVAFVAIRGVAVAVEKAGLQYGAMVIEKIPFRVTVDTVRLRPVSLFDFVVRPLEGMAPGMPSRRKGSEERKCE